MERLTELIRRNEKLLTGIIIYAGLVVVAYLIYVKIMSGRKLSAKLEQQLSVYDATGQERFRALINAMQDAGYDVIITSTVRPGDTGRHGKKRALDFNIVNRKTKVQYMMATPKAQWEATGIPAIIRKMGFRWGGDFVTPWVHNGVTHSAYDPVHADFE